VRGQRGSRGCGELLRVSVGARRKHRTPSAGRRAGRGRHALPAGRSLGRNGWELPELLAIRWGYTTSLDDAERFTLGSAMKQHKCRETDLPWLCSELDKLRRPTVDCQYMPCSRDAQRAAIAAQAAAKEGAQQG
jgi:hypothetical protein